MNDKRTARVIWGTLVIVALCMGGLWFRSPHRDLDDLLCPKDQSITGHTVVLVDQTDALTDRQVGDLKLEVETLEGELRRYERLSIYTIGKEVEVPPHFAFSLCNPGRKGQLDILTETESRAERSFKAKFSQPLYEVLEKFKTPTTEAQSPIIETIREITELPSFDDAVPNRHLIIMSDLLQNTPEISQYHLPRISFEDFQRRAGADQLPDLKGVQVDLFYLPRPSAKDIQGRQHRRFWVQLFDAGGASSVRWCYVGSATLRKEIVECAPTSKS